MAGMRRGGYSHAVNSKDLEPGGVKRTVLVGSHVAMLSEGGSAQPANIFYRCPPAHPNPSPPIYDHRQQLNKR